MIIKKATYKKVRVTQNREVTPDVYGCDCCRKKIPEFPNEPQRLEITVWPDKEHSESKSYHFCSWGCVLKFIPTIKSNYFATLPYIYFDEGKGPRTATDLLKTIGKTKTKKK